MKKLAMLALVALEIMICSCGTSTPNTTPTTAATGNWAVTMTGGDGPAGALDFVTTFSVGSGGGTLDITAFSFLTSGPCFTTTTTENGSAVLTTSSTNQVTGTLSYTVNSGAGNVLALDGTSFTGTSNNGTLSGGVVTGTWALTGSTGCNNQSGTFLMCQGNTTCTPPS